jgi:anaphase-promoting complex subunit 1
MPISTEAFKITDPTVSCRFTGLGSKVYSLEKASVSPDEWAWSSFNNGVSEGLKTPRSKSGMSVIDGNWILLNRAAQSPSQHAGFVFGLGVQGHMRDLVHWLPYGYLIPKEDYTAIGLMLGLSASNIGTANEKVTKLLSVHVPALLCTDTEYATSVRLQTACVLGIGLTYMQTNDRKKIELFASEIVGNKDYVLMSGENIRSLTESYSVASGFAVGFMGLCKGGKMIGIANQLLRYLKGDTTAPVAKLARSQNVPPPKERRKGFMSSEIVAPSGSIVALALMFLKTGRKDIAKKIGVPDTRVGMDGVRTDVIVLRVVGSNLIMWDEIRPINAWIKSQIPDFVYAAVHGHGFTEGEEPELAAYNLFMVHLYIIAGCCLSIGLKFAGSCDTTAFGTLNHWLDYFTRNHVILGMFLFVTLS